MTHSISKQASPGGLRIVHNGSKNQHSPRLDTLHIDFIISEGLWVYQDHEHAIEALCFLILSVCLSAKVGPGWVRSHDDHDHN